jgi:hypothetical protein
VGTRARCSARITAACASADVQASASASSANAVRLDSTPRDATPTHAAKHAQQNAALRRAGTGAYTASVSQADVNGIAM